MSTRTSLFRTHHRAFALWLGILASSMGACSDGSDGVSTPSVAVGGSTFVGGSSGLNTAPSTARTGGSTFSSVVGPTGGTPLGTSAAFGTGGTSRTTGTSAPTGGTTTSGGATVLGGTSNGSGGTTNAGGSKSTTGGASSGGSSASGGAPVGGTAGKSGTGGQTQVGGVSSVGGASGSNPYEPCPTNGDACIVLPFGDSITDGVGSTDLAGYRSPLFKLVVAANQKVNFTGSRSSGPSTVSGKTFPKNHEGHPGWTIDSGYVSYGDGISTLIPSPAFSTIPHLVLLMIGTNDISGTKGTDTIAERLDVLLGKIIAAAPKALIVVAQVTPIRWNPAALSSYNSKIPALIQKRVANGQHIASVDMSKMPTASLSSDGIHPNDTGYAYMADIWYNAIKSHLPK